MERYLSLGGIIFCFDSDHNITADQYFERFLVGAQNPDINVRISYNWTSAPDIAPPPHENCELNYDYQLGDQCFSVKRDCDKNIVVCIVYSADFSKINCYINEPLLYESLDNLASFMRMLPLCRIFTHFGVLFFHAAQIGYRGKGILFTAPSGTGKTTQARLWESSRGAEILCNDRTLVRKSGDEWQTCGFPLDGSTPVANNRTCPLRAIVYLEQGSQCRCERLSPSKALLHLMPQMVIDGWDPQIRAECMRQLLSLMEKIPVYRLVCTPDVRAVEALELQLSKE